MRQRVSVSQRLPDFPWDQLAPAAERAHEHPDGIVDLSVGTPVDPTPESVRRALADAADSPGYPPTIGRVETRQAALDWLARRLGVTGLGPRRRAPDHRLQGADRQPARSPRASAPATWSCYPELAYPTYEVGAMLAGARTLATDSLTAIGPEVPQLLWLNSPGQPDRPGAAGRPPPQGRRLVPRARHGAGLRRVLPRAGLGGAQPVSVLHPDVCGGSPDGVLTVHSLSKRSNLAGYRCAFVAGDPALVGELLAVRKNLGLMMPGPQQVAMAAALADDAPRRRAARAVRRPAGRAAAALWRAPGSGSTTPRRRCTSGPPAGEDCWETVAALADLGILVAPGAFYGAAGPRARPGRPHRDRRAAPPPRPTVTRPGKRELSTARQRPVVKNSGVTRGLYPAILAEISKGRQPATKIAVIGQYSWLKEPRRPPPQTGATAFQRTCASLSRPRRRTGLSPRSGAQPAGRARGRR